MLALCWPLLDLSGPDVAPMFAHVSHMRICWPMSALCWPKLALSCPYVGLMVAYVGAMLAEVNPMLPYVDPMSASVASILPLC